MAARATTICVAIGAACYLLRRLHKSKGCSVDGLADLSSFALEEVLLEGETTILLGRFSWQAPSERALVKLTAKTAKLADGILQSLKTSLSSYSGAEYAYYNASAGLAGLVASQALRPAFAVEVIAPASEKQIARSRPQPGVFVVETAALYRDVVKPYIDGLDPAATAWIGNLLNLSKERERMLYNDTSSRDTGFLLNVDTKWKSHPQCVEDTTARRKWRGHSSVKDLYCLAICHRTDIRSIRDLNASHLPLLRHILTQGTKTVCDVYGVAPHELRVFVHYQPQFYHFHVHFTLLRDTLGCQVERAHLLQEVIESLEADGTAYQRRTLYYQLQANDKLLAKIRQSR
mmetsp:Transcript_18185/g.46562  ORF Transcript_18185/g.46562 Transcript_18185/m.46562 type:complete len:346 (+) Transcript_18185:46-1083(+)